MARTPAEGTFELGLVMAGAVSGGAYAAGVVDFLFEALTAWEAAKQADPDVPDHRVEIRHPEDDRHEGSRRRQGTVSPRRRRCCDDRGRRDQMRYGSR